MTILYKASERTIRQACKTCGSTALYWARVGSPDSKDVVLIDARDLAKVASKGGRVPSDYVHKCHADRFARLTRGENVDNAEHDEQDVTPAPVPVTPAPVAPVAPVVAPDKAAAVAQLLGMLSGPSIDVDTLRAMVKDELGKIVFPTETIVIRENDEPRKVEGLTHERLGAVTRALLRGEHVAMVGPAGTGKSTIGEQASEALGLPFYALSVGPQTSESKIFGYMDATGNYRPTLFRQAYEHGGVFLFDEVDSGNPAVLTSINSALANGHCAFPDGMVKRHDDFRCIATANTYGTGPDRQYVGRQRMDAAFMDRFAVLTIGIDRALEQRICDQTGLDRERVADVLAYVRVIRNNADRHKILHVVSPRASIGMCRLLVGGDFTWSDAVEARVRKGLSDQDWTKLSDNAPVPAWAA